jgi:hypothetical protein
MRIPDIEQAQPEHHQPDRDGRHMPPVALGKSRGRDWTDVSGSSRRPGRLTWHRVDLHEILASAILVIVTRKS